MEGGDNILDAIYEDDNLEDVDDDIEMVDVEEGELLDPDSRNLSVQSSAEGDNANEADKKPHSKNRRRKANKKKNKRKRQHASGPIPINIDRFVLDTCRRLKEKKSYMVYTAVGCLGISALSDIIKEVDAIQACGGQKTTDGKRFRTGGGVLWNIIKVREPQAYKEIMKKAKEFEKQFKHPNVKHPNVKHPPVQKEEDSSQGMASEVADGHQGNVSDSPFPASQMQDQHEPSGSEEKRITVHDRLRVPVSYDDDLLRPTADKDST